MQLGERIGPVVSAPDDDGRLDEPVGNGSSQWVPEDDLLLGRLFVRRGGEADEHPWIEVPDCLGEGWPVVAVMLVGEDNEALDALQVGVELSPQPLLELVRLPRVLRLGANERLHGEEIHLHLRLVVHG